MRTKYEEKLRELGVWKQFVENYMKEDNSRDYGCETAEKYLERCEAFNVPFWTAIYGAFEMDCTKQGFNFWADIALHNEIKL